MIGCSTTQKPKFKTNELLRITSPMYFGQFYFIPTSIENNSVFCLGGIHYTGLQFAFDKNNFTFTGSRYYGNCEVQLEKVKENEELTK